MKSAEVIIYCDGACSGNPGPGGWASIVVVEDRVVELAGEDRATTNNRMEMTAILEALSYCTKNYAQGDIKHIRVYTDSVYVIRGITEWIFGWKKRGWKNSANDDVSNQDIWVPLDQVVSDVKNKLCCEISWNFVKGHSGVEGNERCDKIAVAYSKNEYIDLYKGEVRDYIFDVHALPKIKAVPEMKKKSGSSSAGAAAWYLSYVNGVLLKHATWRECEAVVKGRPAKYKKVSSATEEEAVKKAWGLK